LIPKQHLTGLGRFLTLKPAPDGLLDPKAAPLGLGSLGSLTDTRPVRRLDLSSLAHLGLKAENRCFQSRLDITSDRNAKKNFSSVNALGVLEKVAAMPITRWNYKTNSSSIAHVGPMAQDSHAAFGLNGGDDKHISVVDAQGVTLAAIQGLNQKLEAENAKLRSSLTDLEKRLAALKRK
jgi:hypothetical protein